MAQYQPPQPTHLHSLIPTYPNYLSTSLRQKWLKCHNVAETMWLVKWLNSPIEEATWEMAKRIEDKYPNFDPQGQGSS